MLRRSMTSLLEQFQRAPGLQTKPPQELRRDAQGRLSDFREVEVLRWVACGKTNRDIGDILGLSPRTVNKHLEHVYVKLGVETRTAATSVALAAMSPSRAPMLATF